MDSQMPMSQSYVPPYRSYAAYLRERFGEKVHRIALDAGFGCPHREGGRGAGGCIYCGPAGAGNGASDARQSVSEQMEQGIARLKRKNVQSYVAYFQAFCGTAASPGRLRKIYLEAVRFPGVKGLSVGTRPDLVQEEVLDVLEEFSRNDAMHPALEVWLELGLQSAHDPTLIRINRGHNVASFDRAVYAARQRNLNVAAHVILGLPGEDETRMMATARHLAGLPIQGVKLHHLFVEKYTELAELYARGLVPVLSLDDYISLSIGFLRRLGEETVILRLAGKAQKNLQIAPQWLDTPGTVAQKIAQKMVRNGWRQGDLHQKVE
ncbi:MAG: TIGR01212 family radical SAM protein [Planctomycetes bacterium]|nr:TIGR01212 family radical SAM protein [Planctomycetota bacterium]